MNVFLAALMLLTRIFVLKIEVSKIGWKKSHVYFPLIGLLIGCLIYEATCEAVRDQEG